MPKVDTSEPLWAKRARNRERARQDARRHDNKMKQYEITKSQLDGVGIRSLISSDSGSGFGQNYQD